MVHIRYNIVIHFLAEHGSHDWYRNTKFQIYNLSFVREPGNYRIP